MRLGAGGGPWDFARRSPVTARAAPVDMETCAGSPPAPGLVRRRRCFGSSAAGAGRRQRVCRSICLTRGRWERRAPGARSRASPRPSPRGPGSARGDPATGGCVQVHASGCPRTFRGAHRPTHRINIRQHLRVLIHDFHLLSTFKLTEKGVSLNSDTRGSRQPEVELQDDLLAAN